ncbi:unnamed protein product [Adineta steineri]|uniref:Uncharacterized protein n=1 Tax=Adineta steineri TaxID=433720 RepID=A0A814K795_9BILA|nr:unnamed protein product [Adineta steineri]CAF0940711.1 unnamed protein product [Adineta steineri]CAF1047619.1 unnamed protein product [Adineta steineri]
MTSMNANVLPPERSFREVSSAVNPENHSNAIPARRRQNDADDPTVHLKKTRLICLVSILSSRNGVRIFAMFTVISMVIAILIVYFRSPKPLGRTCEFILKSEAYSSIRDDSLPHSIAVADLNNDGLLDIVVPNSGANNIGVFLRNSNNTFKAQTVYSTGLRSIPYAVAVSDFNNDQRIDIAVANFGNNNVGIFLGTDNGTFRSQTIFSTGSSRPRCLATGDFNKDGIIDIVVVNYGTNDIGILLGDGRGNFIKWTTFPTGFDSIPYSLAIADVNHDNELDIVVANYGTNNVGVLLGLGNGSFMSQTTFYIAYNSAPYSVTVHDLNNDTHIDIIVGCSNTNYVAVLLGFGNGLFSLPTKYSTGNNSSPRSITIGDFDKDNKVDIAVANYGTASVGIFFGYGNGTYSHQVTFYTSYDSLPYAIVSGDINNDTRLDIAVVNYDYNYVDIVLTYRNYSFSDQITYPTIDVDSQPISIAVADFNNDNRPDFVVVNNNADNINVFLNDGNNTFLNQTTYLTDSQPLSVAVGDFNNDTHPDIVVISVESGTIGIFFGFGNGIFSNQTILLNDDSSQPYTVAVGDLNNDSQLDIVVANKLSDNISIFFGYGNGSFSDAQTYSTNSGSRPVWVGIADFNNDNRSDIVVINGVSGDVGLFLGYDDDTFSYQIVFSVGTGAGPNGGAIGDLNADGRMDIVVNIYYNRAFQILLGFGNGTFVSKTIYSVGSLSRPSWCTIADWNNDQRLDIIVSSCDTNNIHMFVGYGDGTFLSEQAYSTGDGSCPLASGSGDLNNDGLLDVVVVNSRTNTVGVFLEFTYMNGIREATYATGSASHPRAIGLGHFINDVQLDVVMANYGLGNVGFLEGHTNGTFPIQTMFSTGVLSFPTSIAIDDLNNDNKLDIVVANPSIGNLSIFYGYENGSFASQKTYSVQPGSFPQSVICGDFNNDKKRDIAVVYSGSNSVSTLLRYDTVVLKKQAEYFTGTSSYPHAVSVGDFNNDGWSDFVTVNRGSQSISIFLGLGNATFSGPTTHAAGTGSPSYGIVVGHVNNDTYLDIVVSHYWRNAVSIFLGFGNGTFSSPTNYSTGDPCYPIGVGTGDLNNDGQLDVVVACDKIGGISILLGYGNGTFGSADVHPINPGVSGARYVAIADFNNDNNLDIVLTNAGTSSIHIFQGYGNGIFFLAYNYTTGVRSSPRPVAVSDLDKDGQMDIIVGNSGSDNICVFFGYGDGSFSVPTFHPIENGSLSYGLVINDFNNDGQLDIAVANYGSNNLAILLKLVNRTFFNPLTYSTGDYSQPSFLAVADFNNDSHLDIVVPDSGINSVSIFLGNINEDFLIAPDYPVELSSQLTSIGVGDFDNDTQLDIVVADNATNNIMIIFGSGYGTFTRQNSYSTGNNSHPCSVAVGDFNKDNQLDIVVANSGANNIGVFLANSSGTFLSQMVYLTGSHSQPYSVAVLDFDNDTQLDIAVANYGSSSVGVFLGHGNGHFSDQMIFYTGFNSHPFGLAVGDVNNDNFTDIVASNNGYGNIDILMKIC